MARGFGATYGVDANDIITTTYTAAITGQRSYFCWVFVNGPGGSGLGRVFDKGINQELFVASSGSHWNFDVTWTGSLAEWDFNIDPSNNVWHSLLITYDATSTANDPNIYVDGSLVSISKIVAPSGSINTDTSAFTVGNRSNLTRNFDGKIAWFSVWDGVLLTALEATALSKGVLPIRIRPASLSCCVPLFGNISPEPQNTPFGAATVSGTASQFGSPALSITPRRPVVSSIGFTAAVAGAFNPAWAFQKEVVVQGIGF